MMIVVASLVSPIHAQPPGMPPAPVVVSKVQEVSQASSKSFVGTLVPIRKSTVGSAVDGRVTKIHVQEGDPVTVDTTGQQGPTANHWDNQ
jgi:multidrug efflux pump subunit AcrA (membrane-fusion protein)